jgi:ABC-type glycerol-3-phosphate transport system substrate-binding protein
MVGGTIVNIIRKYMLVAIVLVVCITLFGCNEATNTPATSGSPTDGLESGESSGETTSEGLSEESQTDSVGNSATDSDESSGIGSSGSTGVSTSPTSTSVSSAAEVFVRPTYDLGGKTVIFWVPPGVGTPRTNTAEYASWKDIEKRYNCVIKFQKVDYQTAVTKNTAAALSGTAECDIWMPEWYNVFPSFIAKNMVTPLSDYYSFDKDPNWKGDDPQKNLLWGGKKYGLFAGSEVPMGGLWYNKTLLRRANLEDPASLVAKNQWTWDKFLDMCKKLTVDTNKDGITDQWGYYDVYLFENAIITNGGKFVDVSNPSAPTFNIDNDKDKRAIKWALDLVRTYKVVPEVGTVYNMELFDLFYNYKAAFFTYTPAFGKLCVTKGMDPEELGYTYFPKGPDAKDYALHAPTLNLLYAIMPQTRLDKNALTCLLADYVCIWDPTEDYAIAKEDLREYSYTKSGLASDLTIFKNNKDFLMNGHKKNVPSYDYNFLIGDIVTNNLWIPLAEGEIDIQSGITAVTPAIQSAISQMMVQASN